MTTLKQLKEDRYKLINNKGEVVAKNIKFDKGAIGGKKLEVKDIYTNEKFTRPSDEENINAVIKLLKGGHPIGAIQVVKRDEKDGFKYEVVNGHHRLAAFKKAGEKKIPAMIIPDLEEK